MANIAGLGLAVLLTWTLAAQVALAEEGRWQALENNPACVVWNGDPLEQETVTWSGACANGKAQGRGTEVWRYFEDGEWKESKYEGGMKDGKKHGPGVYVWASGNRYEGDYKDDKLHGRGTYHFANGDECDGKWREGRLLGTGRGWKNGCVMKCYMDGNTMKWTD